VPSENATLGVAVVVTVTGEHVHARLDRRSRTRVQQSVDMSVDRLKELADEIIELGTNGRQLRVETKW
jgi:ribosomal protein L13E